MKVVEGELSLIGHGTWEDGGGGGKTIVSALDIGDHHLQRILVPDYLRNYVTPGEHVRVAISQGFSRGVITRPFIAAVEANGKKRQVGFGQLTLVGVVGLAGVAAVGYHYYKEIQGVREF